MNKYYFSDTYTSYQSKNDILYHSGKGHKDGGHSGRYPWGSGERAYQRSPKEIFRNITHRKSKESVKKSVGSDASRKQYSNDELERAKKNLYTSKAYQKHQKEVEKQQIKQAKRNAKIEKKLSKYDTPKSIAMRQTKNMSDEEIMAGIARMQLQQTYAENAQKIAEYSRRSPTKMEKAKKVIAEEGKVLVKDLGQKAAKEIGEAVIKEVVKSITQQNTNNNRQITSKELAEEYKNRYTIEKYRAKMEAKDYELGKKDKD